MKTTYVGGRMGQTHLKPNGSQNPSRAHLLSEKCREWEC